MKCLRLTHGVGIPVSPSMRREWIEITNWRIMDAGDKRLPPCGGSGLKLIDMDDFEQSEMSPSMRREWIEMSARMLYSKPGP